MLDSIRTRLVSEDGQALVEYTLIVSLIAVICIAALTVTGHSLSGILNAIAGDV
jgi:pilus assembly protein Flp/PilA